MNVELPSSSIRKLAMAIHQSPGRGYQLSARAVQEFRNSMALVQRSVDRDNAVVALVMMADWSRTDLGATTVSDVLVQLAAEVGQGAGAALRDEVHTAADERAERVCDFQAFMGSAAKQTSETESKDPSSATAATCFSPRSFIRG
jgi:hypothetical protein